MAVKDVAGTQASSFVSRTRTIDRLVKNETITTLLKHVGGAANAIYEPTASNGNTLSTHFMVTSQSNVEALSTFSGSMMDGSSYTGKGLVTGTMYPIALSYVSASSHVQIDLFGSQTSS